MLHIHEREPLGVIQTAMIKIITGRVGDKEIKEQIDYFQPHVGEQIATAKRNIIRKFESSGYSEEDVIFNE